jgi:hypothetical protein
MWKYTWYWKDATKRINEIISLCNFFIKKSTHITKKEKVLDRNKNLLPDYLYIWCFAILEWYYKLTKEAIIADHSSYIFTYSISTQYQSFYEDEYEKRIKIILKVDKIIQQKTWANNTLTSHHLYRVIKIDYDSRNAIIHRWVSWKTYQDVIILANNIQTFMKFCDIHIKKTFTYL